MNIINFKLWKNFNKMKIKIKNKKINKDSKNKIKTNTTQILKRVVMILLLRKIQKYIQVQMNQFKVILKETKMKIQEEAIIMIIMKTKVKIQMKCNKNFKL